MKAEVQEIMKRGVINQQTPDGESHHMKNEVRAALHSKAAGFLKQTQCDGQLPLECSEEAVATCTAKFQSQVHETRSPTRQTQESQRATLRGETEQALQKNDHEMSALISRVREDASCKIGMT